MANLVTPSEVSLDHNEECLLNNPLASKLPEELDREAEEVAHLAKADPVLFKKAARLAEDPSDWESVHRALSLTDTEKKALREERSKGFWHQPKYLKVCTAIICFSATIQGWVQSSINGANLDWPLTLRLLDTDNGKFVDENARWAFAGVNAVTFLAASLFGCWLSDPLQEIRLSMRESNAHKSAALGRRGAIFFSCCLVLASLIGAACSRTWQQLLACRAILGLGIGAKASITPIYGAEISPSHLRGRLVMTWQMFDTCGILLGFTANLILYRVDSNLNWRFQIAAALLPTICLMTLCWTVPESPRWLLKQGRYAEALESMCLIRETPLQAAREIFYANAQLQVEVNVIPKNIREKILQKKYPDLADVIEVVQAKDIEQVVGFQSDQEARSSQNIARNVGAFQEVARVTMYMYWLRIWQLFANKRTRRATVAAGIVMFSQQLCGINIIMFYSTTFFGNINSADSTAPSEKEKTSAIWMSWGIGWTNFLFTIPAYWFIDTRGRRFLLLITYPGMILCMLGAGLGFLDESSNPKTKDAVVGVFVYLFVMFYSLGQGPVAFTYSSEVFPLINREAGMSFAVFLNFLGTGLLTLFAPLAQMTTPDSPNKASYNHAQTRLLAVFVGLNVLAFILIFFLVPETSEAIFDENERTLLYASLEELNWIFSVKTGDHIKYQTHKMLRYFWEWTIWYCNPKYIGRPKEKQDEKPKKPKKLIKWAWMEAKSRDLTSTEDPIRELEEDTSSSAQ